MHKLPICGIVKLSILLDNFIYSLNQLNLSFCLSCLPTLAKLKVLAPLAFIFCHNGHQVYVDKEFEGKILMFPAGLSHCVYPFYTSNKKRITSSGNIYFLNEKDGQRND